MTHPIVLPEVDREFVLAKCDYFVDVQLWPIRSKLNPEAWLSNFDDSEANHATHLLNAFMYFSGAMVEQLFVHAFHDLNRHFYVKGQSLKRFKAAWRSFLDTVVLTRVTGETPSDTDSGFMFVRMARQLLHIPEERILSPAATLRHLIEVGPSPIVFVDDFVGSGNQFADTWNRLENVPNVDRISFNLLSKVIHEATFYYCPLLCTQRGYQRIKKEFPMICIEPAHILSERYSAFAPDSLVWPKALLPTAPAFLQKATARAGVDVGEMAGFHQFGLTLAFEHGVPDATLPIFYSEKNGWKPLIKRT